MKYLALLLLVAGTGAIAASQYSQTIRAVDLKALPSADAANIAALPEKAQVEVLKRQGAWFQVKAPAGSGWLRMLAVRGEGGASELPPAKSGSMSGLRHLVGAASGESAVATGVRGLNEEDLAGAQPNPAELQALQEWASNAGEARKFADQAKLKPQTVAYLVAAATSKSRGEGK